VGGGELGGKGGKCERDPVEGWGVCTSGSS
jgi:hypothetical protein